MSAGYLLPPVGSDFHDTLLVVSAGEYLQMYREFFRYLLSKEMADFYVLQVKPGPATSRHHCFSFSTSLSQVINCYTRGFVLFDSLDYCIVLYYTGYDMC